MVRLHCTQKTKTLDCNGLSTWNSSENGDYPKSENKMSLHTKVEEQSGWGLVNTLEVLSFKDF